MIFRYIKEFMFLKSTNQSLGVALQSNTRITRSPVLYDLDVVNGSFIVIDPEGA